MAELFHFKDHRNFPLSGGLLPSNVTFEEYYQCRETGGDLLVDV